MTPISSGYVVIYGGRDNSNRTLTDYWHLRIDINGKVVEAFQTYLNENEFNVQRIIQSR